MRKIVRVYIYFFFGIPNSYQLHTIYLTFLLYANEIIVEHNFAL